MKLGRFSVYGTLSSVPLPFATYVNEGPEWRYSDSLVTVEIDLTARATQEEEAESNG